MEVKDFMLAHTFSSNNMNALKNDNVCGCFYCLKIFSPTEIEDWQINDCDCDRYGTAVCPYCSVDSIIGESSGYSITEEFLKGMYKRWFEADSEEEY